MNTQHSTRPLRAALAIRGSQGARTFLAHRAALARELDRIAPGITTVRTVPVWTDGSGTGRWSTWVTLDNALGQPLTANRAAHRDARQLLHSAFPGADWTRPQDYDTHTGQLTTPPQLAAPAGLGIDTAPVSR
ncbi:hypothetical protein [Streptomyces sp. NBC_01718]|uniref:hypothetical protein n=1 Tax=Streptomyces sp. NBC_01718 TaxID=2975919 RepID=UPI00352D4AE4